MDKDQRRAELAARIKASFCVSDNSEELKLYTRIMNQVYDWQRDDDAVVRIHENMKQTHPHTGINI